MLSVKDQLSLNKNMFIWDNGNKEKDVVEVNKYGEMALAIRDIG